MNRFRISDCSFRFLLIAAILIVGFSPAPGADETGGVHRIYTERLDPREHPDYARRHVQPPGLDVFGGKTRFTSLRGFNVSDGRIVDYSDELDKYTLQYQLGDVIWPSYPVLFAENLGDLADEINKRDLFLFDIWGYVPGSGPGGYWQQYKPPAGVFDLLETRLGERWLGMDVGEQDGRYIGGYASQMTPGSSDRFHQYLNFQRHFQRMCDDLGNRMSTLVSLNFGHYFLKEGVYTLIGAETAQGLPNGQVYYSFIRGAGKQYGVPWFGNASIYNRWGYKSYGGEGGDHGPTKGSSLSLMKRLMYSHILYNCVFAGFENGWFDAGGALSPIGRIQASARKWTREQEPPGVMMTPIALMVDFYSGWSFPRHLYSGDIYRVWGNLPYQPGDYLTDGVLDMLYPGYQDSSYFHDEKGFLTPTPYGDAADCLLSDAPLWLLKRYPALVIAGELSGGLELKDKLSEYIQSGGELYITAGSLAKLPGGLAGVEVNGTPAAISERSVTAGDRNITEKYPFSLYPLTFPENARVIARCGGRPAVLRVDRGGGGLTVFASPFGVSEAQAPSEAIASHEDRSLPNPYPLLNHVRAVLARAFQKQMLFDAGSDLSMIVCRKGSGRYVLGIGNNGWEEKPMRITSRCGPMVSIHETPLDQSEKDAVGYLPESVNGSELGSSGDRTIAGGDVRIFEVTVREENVAIIPHVKPPAAPAGRILPLRDIDSIQEAILARPTFFDHYDGVTIDWRYLNRRDRRALVSEAGWLANQSPRVMVDLSSGINLYPDLRLTKNDDDEYAASMAAIDDVIEKMEILHANDLLLTLHRVPENNYTAEQTRDSFEETLRRICGAAAKRGIAVYLRMTEGKPPWSLKEAEEYIQRTGASNLRLALPTAWLMAHNADDEAITKLRDRIGLWLAGSARRDISGRLWSINAPVADCDDMDRLRAILALAPDAPIVFDAFYDSRDAEYADAGIVQRLTSAKSEE
ncbi:MAG: TIM barrel protein [bacterium]|nr:TIM barrel protein [bacterium]